MLNSVYIYMYVLDWRTTRGGREEARKVTMDLAQLPPIFLPAAVGNPLPLPALSDLKMQLCQVECYSP